MEMEMEEERERKAPVADTVAEEEEEDDEVRRMRIYVGGLSEKVSEEDLRKTFSSLGRVEGVDFVRTSGRNFAYLDFHPSTDKSLSKLFSSYNGCVWKGGKLRLEKAKEHYLSRLRREWDEDTKLAEKTNKEPVADESKDPPQKSKPVTLEKKQLQIFFPKLRKVKSVPYSGTGKHKYSFQRIEVPSLPIHFCDCEEHCAPDIAKVKQKSDLEDQAGNVNEEELNMMTSVMNRLFKRGVNSNTECSKVIGPMEGGSSKHSMEDVPFKGSVDQDNHLKDSLPSNAIDVDQDDDADNLVINMVGGGNTRSGSMENGRLENVNQESKFGKRHLSTVGSTQNKIKAWEENSDPFNSPDTISKKARLLPSDESTRNELKFTMPKKKDHPDNCSKSPTAPLVIHSDQTRNIQQLNTSLSWRQKSSWRNLVGETANSSFSISQILPGPSTSQNSRKSDILPDPIINQSSPTSNCFDTANTTDRKRQKLKKQVRPKSTNSEPGELGNVENLQGKVSADATPVDQDEILQDKVCTGGHFDDTQKLRKLVTCDSANMEPARLEKGEILQEKVSTDNSSIEAQKLLKQGISDATGSELAELVKDAILQNKVSLDGPSVNTETGIPFKEPDNPEKVEATDQKVTNHQTGCSWIQKSSWTELVGKMDNSSFSISNILPDIAAKRLNLPNDDSTDTINPFDNKQHSAKQLTSKVIGRSSSDFRKSGTSHDKITPIGANIISSAKEKDTLVGLEGVIDGVEKSSEKGKMGDKLSGGKTFSASNKRTFDAGIGEACTFMRSKESEKEWLKAKAALSAALKKKSSEK